MKFFDDRFECPDNGTRLLPFCHSCNAYIFRLILESKQVNTSLCDVFAEDLLYLFYGKPGYRTKEPKNSGLAAYLPVTIIFKNDTLERSLVKRIFPFDTGAFKKNLYADFIPVQMAVNNFLMNPNENAILRTIGYFFADNENYFKGIAKSQIKYDPFDFEVECYHSLINSKQLSLLDDRKACIEIQIAEPIVLHPDTIDAVIIPDVILSSTLVEDVLINQLQITPLVYETFGALKPTEYYAEVLKMTMAYIKSTIN